MSFKLIAIRPLVGISSQYLKNLVAGEVYNLCNDYSLLNKQAKQVLYEEHVYSIGFKQTVPENLYSIKKISGEAVNINISAVVGKNGAGKSSLMDLLLQSIFIVSNNLDLVIPENFVEQVSNNLEQNELNSYNKELKEIESGLKVEVYYLLNNKYYRLSILEGKALLESYPCSEEKARFSKDDISIKDYKELNNFFYNSSQLLILFV